MNPFLNKGYHVFTDNYYNSVVLTEFLSKKSTKSKKDRKENPKEVTAGKPKKAF